MESNLDWLPEPTDWHERLAAARSAAVSSSFDLSRALRVYQELARFRMDLALTAKLDRALQRLLNRAAENGFQITEFTRARLALLGSSTLGHLIPAIRIGGLRRGLLIDVYEGPYGTWRQELSGEDSGLRAFRPQVLLLALDARTVAEMERTMGSGAALRAVQEGWHTARGRYECAVIQQSAMPVLPAVIGHAEYRLPESPAAILERFNGELRDAAAASEGVHLLAVDQLVRQQGLASWYSAGLWYRAKQEVHPAMAPLYGDHVGRIVGALMGRSAKCLVLDLDHTLWGGGIGDDGLEGIVVGQGSALGEAHLAVQRYALALRERGIVLAVCSKNDESNALLPFEQHPEMLLKRNHFACFRANWDDKATNLRRIARELSLGLDALVFVDDNPAERGLVRRELPEVHVPELPHDPAEFVPTLAAAGYFESLGITLEDRSRAALYTGNARRNAERAEAQAEGATGLESYLASLNMQLEARPFDASGRLRIVQLINKTNQFNLTTRRVLESEVDRLSSSPCAITLQLGLKDIYGDHGVIAVVVAEPAGSHPLLSHAESMSAGELAQSGFPEFTLRSTDLLISHWLMSCRVFGREVESATFNLLAEQALAHGAQRLLGIYLPTAKNGMVRDLYRRLGFERAQTWADGASVWSFELARFSPVATHITVHAEALALQRVR